MGKQILVTNDLFTGSISYLLLKQFGSYCKKKKETE